MTEITLTKEEAVEYFDRWMRASVLEMKAGWDDHDEDLAEAYYQMRKGFYQKAKFGVWVGMHDENIEQQQMAKLALITLEFGADYTLMAFHRITQDAIKDWSNQ